MINLIDKLIPQKQITIEETIERPNNRYNVDIKDKDVLEISIIKNGKEIERIKYTNSIAKIDRDITALIKIDVVDINKVNKEI